MLPISSSPAGDMTQDQPIPLVQRELVQSSSSSSSITTTEQIPIHIPPRSEESAQQKAEGRSNSRAKDVRIISSATDHYPSLSLSVYF